MTISDDKNIILKYLVLLLCLGGLCAYSLLFIYSTGYIGDAFPVRPTWQKQTIFLALGMFLFMPLTAFVCSKDYLRPLFIRIGYGLSLLALLLVLFFGHKTGGATRWLPLGPFLFQPAEFAKIFTVLMATDLLIKQGRYMPFVKTVLCTLPTFTLILIEPSYGSAISLLPAFFVLSLFALPGKRLFSYCLSIVILCMILGTGTLLWLRTEGGSSKADKVLLYLSEHNLLLKEYHVKRIKGYLDENGSWNERQSVMTISSGGTSGKGFLEGTMKSLGYLPRTVAPTDFIFPVICEELGFCYGALPVISLYVLLLGILLYGSVCASTSSQQLSCIGVAMMLFTHIVVNLAMTMRLLPIIGLPLPILSYGGSYAIATFIALGAALPGKIEQKKSTTPYAFTWRLGKIIKLSINQ